MRLIITLFIAFVTTLMSMQQAFARPARPGPLVTIFGQVHDEGKGVSNILVEVKTGSCFAPTYKKVRTNQSGFYRIDGLSSNNFIYVGVNGFSKIAESTRYKATCGKSIQLSWKQTLNGSRGLNRHNIALQKSSNTPASPSPETTTIYGKLDYKGKAVSYVLVEVRVGSCSSKVLDYRSSNKAGFYRIDGLPLGKLVYVGVKDKRYHEGCGGGIQLKRGQLNRYNLSLKHSWE